MRASWVNLRLHQDCYAKNQEEVTRRQEQIRAEVSAMVAAHPALPCPFCGTEPVVERWRGPYSKLEHVTHVYCENSKCRLNVQTLNAPRKHTALDTWNQRAPIDLVLHCPQCGKRHVDQPDAPDRYCVTEADGSCSSTDPRCMHQPEPAPRWENPPHRSHLCAGCGYIWRPADVPTNGVAATLTRGQLDCTMPAVTRTPTITVLGKRSG